MSEHITATERLRALLDERGVEWESGLPTETIVRELYNALYVERPDGRMHVYFRSYLTPEQAIAATLGPCSDSCSCTNGERTGERMYLDPATLDVTGATGARQDGVSDARPTKAESSGTLTAEKVRELIEENSRQYPSPTDPYVWLTEYDWQVIADELNATLGRRTCHVMTIGEFNGEGTEYYDYCSNCGYEFFDDDPLNYCPNCGRRIEVESRWTMAEYVCELPVEGMASFMSGGELIPVHERIVRCRDCKHMHRVRNWLGMDVDECWLHADRESGALGKVDTDPDGFCKWGERKGSE